MTRKSAHIGSFCLLALLLLPGLCHADSYLPDLTQDEHLTRAITERTTCILLRDLCTKLSAVSGVKIVCDAPVAEQKIQICVRVRARPASGNSGGTSSEGASGYSKLCRCNHQYAVAHKGVFDTPNLGDFLFRLHFVAGPLPE